MEFENAKLKCDGTLIRGALDGSCSSFGIVRTGKFILPLTNEIQNAILNGHEFELQLVHGTHLAIIPQIDGTFIVGAASPRQRD